MKYVILVSDVIAYATAFWLPIDLLYLYYAGAWSDSRHWVLITELVILYGLPLLTVWRIMRWLHRLARGRK